MGKKVNAWMEHLKAFRKDHPDMNNKLIFSAAKKTYKKQSGGGALGGSLSSSPISGIGGTSGVALQTNATLYSGGSSKRRRSSKRRSSRRRSSRRQ